jgi:hypothetical protein
MANWGDTWPDGRKIEPAPGMLVAFRKLWFVTIDNPNHDPEIHPWLIRITDGYCPGTVYEDRCTPIAPPPQPGKLWDALIMLGEVGECSDELTIALERGDIHASPYTGSNQKNYEPHEGVVDEWDYNNGTMRDMQKFGALLEYCAQEGWE